MKSHLDIVGDAPDGLSPHLRLVLLTKVADVSYSEVERAQRLPRGSISSYARGQSYAYPRLRRAISLHLAGALGKDEQVVQAYLFPDDVGAEVP